ncbi:hypothetical protein BGZ46_001981, partial [Entomortierella lignicola]
GSSLGNTSSDTGEGNDDPATKKAEQNRAAQRAFRQRKQQYIKWLESKAEELNEAYRIVSLVRYENEQLRKLVVDLEVNLNEGDQQQQQQQPRAINAPSAHSSITNNSNISALLSNSSLSEVSMDLMNMATLPGFGLVGERKIGAVGRPKYNPRSSIDGKKSRVKGRLSLKRASLDDQNLRQQNAVGGSGSIADFTPSPISEIPPSISLPPVRHFPITPTPTMTPNIQSSISNVHPCDSKFEFCRQDHVDIIHSFKPSPSLPTGAEFSRIQGDRLCSTTLALYAYSSIKCYR